MQQVKHRNLEATTYIDRIIGQYTQGIAGPHLLVFAGIHGNEPSGVFALENIFRKLTKDAIPISGKLTGITGNLKALGSGVRYYDEDMNRLFLPERIEKVRQTKSTLNTEENELKIITELVDKLTAGDTDVFFVDCHSTSAESEPFISMNTGYTDSYAFVRGLPVNAVIGIEREIKGCLSEYYNQRGFHGFTFEAGQHEAVDTVHNQEAMIWLSLIKAGCLDPQITAHISHAEEVLASNIIEGFKFFSVISSYAIKEEEHFRMEPGFVNLQPIEKGQLLAYSNGNPVYAPDSGRILMPLYQKQGNHGYFFAREIHEHHLIQNKVVLK